MPPARRHYQAPQKPLVTAWARHLDARMRELNLSQTNVFELVRDELGYAPKSRSALHRVFSDKEPEPRQAEALARHFGMPPDFSPPKPEPVAIDPVAAAIEAQTKVMSQQLAATRMQNSLMSKLLTALAAQSGAPVDDALLGIQRLLDEDALASASLLRTPDPLATPAR